MESELTIMRRLGFILLCVVGCLTPPSAGQTMCSLKVRVPDISYCDSTALLEDNVEREVFETRGKVQSVQDFQTGAFELNNKHINDIANQKVLSDASIRDIAEEVATLKRFLDGIVTMYDEGLDDDVDGVERQRRAGTQSAAQLQPLLDAARNTFKTALNDVNNKIQNLTSSFTADLQLHGAEHAQLLKEVVDNGQDILKLERDLTTLENAISQQAINMTSSSSGSGTSLNGVAQDVIDLRINASVAELLAQRQLDLMTSQLQKVSSAEAAIAGSLPGIESQLNAVKNNLTTVVQDAANLIAGDTILETQVNDAITRIKADLASIRSTEPIVTQKIAETGRQLFNYTIDHMQFESDLRAAKSHVDSAQTMVSFSSNLQRQQTTDILLLKKEVRDDINVLKYAFGIRSTMP